MEETKIAIKIELNTTNLEVADAIVRKMIKTLNAEELKMIGKFKVSKTIAEVEVSAEVFEEAHIKNEN